MTLCCPSLPKLLSLAALAALAGTMAMVGSPARPAQDAPAKPGPVHALLAKCAGEWVGVTKFAMDPTQPPMEMQSTATVKMVLDGRFLQMEEKGEMMGQPYTTIKLHGYNSAAKRAEAVWVWTNDDSMMVLSGEAKDGGKLHELTGTAQQDGEAKEFAVKLEIKSDDEFVMTLTEKGHVAGDAPWATTYRRAKAKADGAK